MKRIIFSMVILNLIFSLTGCTLKEDMPHTEKASISKEERQRIDLYVAAMKGAFNMENGGSQFIAVDLTTLKDLSDDGKQEVLNQLRVLSDEVYDFEKVKNDTDKFEMDSFGNLHRSIEGTLLSIYLEKYNEKDATITGISWFGNLGAILPHYEATYENGRWILEMTDFGMS